MITMEADTLPNLSKLLATENWIISEYKVLGGNQVSLVLIWNEKKSDIET